MASVSGLGAADPRLVDVEGQSSDRAERHGSIDLAGRDLPTRWLLRAGRPTAQWLLRRWYDVRLHQADRMPATGPVVVASNHLGWIDGPALAILSPRPVHALTKEEMFDGAMLGRFLLASGQIPLDRFDADPSALRACASVLAHGGAVGVFPEGTRGAGDLRRFHHGAAYLALATGAPVVPLSFFGTRLPGRPSGSIPPRGTRVDLVFGEPWRIEATPWPRPTSEILAASAELMRHMHGQLADAQRLTGRELPGPLPDRGDADPDTGFNTDLES